jgi:hypothetical protein
MIAFCDDDDDDDDNDYYYSNFSLLSFSWEIFTYPGMYHQQD